MINEETKRKLREMNLNDVIDILDVQQKDPLTLSLTFDERLQRIVDYAYQQRNTKRIQNLIKSAKFRFPHADMHSLDYVDRGFSKETVLELLAGGFMETNTNIICQGYTGSGKTFLSCAIGKEICSHIKRVRYIRLPDLLVMHDDCHNLSSQHIERLLSKFSRYDLLILDEWLMEALTEAEKHFIFELIERRYDTGSTIFCTQYKQEDWLSRLGGDVHAEAITDRIVHNAVWLNMGSRNMRERNTRN